MVARIDRHILDAGIGAAEQADLFPPQKLLIEARQEVERGRHDPHGVECPCCFQLAKVYKRRFNVTMARALIWLYQQGGQTRFVYVNRDAPRFIVNNGGTFALMRHWELIECAHNDDESKRTSGRWRLTALGVEFVLKRRALPERVHLYNNEVIGWSMETVNISTALDNKFDYAELMKQ